jgi:nitrogen fixation/metabolism regulation signal transduction histidine kinase
MAEELQAVTRGLRAAPVLAADTLEPVRVVSRELSRRVEGLLDLHKDRVSNLVRNSQYILEGVVALYLFFIPVAGVLIVLTSLVFRRRVAVPLRALSDAALAIAGGRLDQRVPVLRQDELGQVSLAFNVMAERLEQREREVSALNDELNHRYVTRHSSARSPPQ